MSNFERVLSDDELWAAAAEVEWQGTIGQYRLIEQAVLAKLAEQGPVMYARTYYGEIDWDEACVTEKNDGALMHATDMRKEDFVRHGYAVIPLYAHPMPCVSPTSDKTACVSENAESEMQTNSQGILDSSGREDKKELPPLPEADVYGYRDSYSEWLMLEYGKSAIEHYKAMLAAAPKYTGEK